MKIENHIRNVKESIAHIERAIKEGILQNQRTIGFHASAAAADLFELVLHKKNLISMDYMVKHEWFLSKHKINEKFNFEFEGKQEMLDLIHKIEERRNTLCYGTQQKEDVLKQVIENFNSLKKKCIELGINEIE